MSEFEHYLNIFPAWDRRDPNPAKDYGVRGVEICFTVVSNRRAVTWDAAVDWYQPRVGGNLRGLGGALPRLRLDAAPSSSPD